MRRVIISRVLGVFLSICIISGLYLSPGSIGLAPIVRAEESAGPVDETTVPTNDMTRVGEEENDETDIIIPVNEPLPDDTQDLTNGELEQSTGVEGFVDRCYQIALGRKADPDGFKNWVTSLKEHRITAIATAFGFLFSTEYTGKNTDNDTYVTNLYQLMLGREPDSAGKKNWTDLLNSGAGRQDIFAGFANSVEFRLICDSYGVTQGYYKAGFNVGQSSQITLFVERLYAICLGRTGDNPGVTDWTRQLVEGVNTGAGVAYGFLFSPEFQNQAMSSYDFVNILYITFLGRDPDSAGFENWASQLRHGASMESVFSGFANSVEFSNICASYGITRGEYFIPDSGLHYLHGVPEASDDQTEIFALSPKYSSLLSIPEEYPQSYQIKVTGTDEIPKYKAVNDNVNVSETGLVTPKIETLYVDPKDGSLSPDPNGDPNQDKLFIVGWGYERIEVTVGDTVLYVDINVRDYLEINLDITTNKFIAERFTSSMTMYDKVKTICEYMATFGFDYNTYDPGAMIITGVGSTYGYHLLFQYFCNKLELNNRMIRVQYGYDTIIQIDEAFYDVGFVTANTPENYYSIQQMPRLSYGVDSNQRMSLLKCYGFSPTETIAATYGGKAVTSIGAWAFESDGQLTEIIMPDSITFIGFNSFSGCYNLKKCNISTNVTYIEQYAFQSAGIETITLPKGITAINEGTFFSCYYLKSITIPAKVTSIGTSAFNACMSLSDVTLPNGLVSIGTTAFSNCSSLKTITIPKSVTSIGSEAFSYCADGFTIKGSAGSYAETYAKNNGITFQAI